MHEDFLTYFVLINVHSHYVRTLQYRAYLFEMAVNMTSYNVSSKTVGCKITS